MNLVQADSLANKKEKVFGGRDSQLNFDTSRDVASRETVNRGSVCSKGQNRDKVLGVRQMLESLEEDNFEQSNPEPFRNGHSALAVISAVDEGRNFPSAETSFQVPNKKKGHHKASPSNKHARAGSKSSNKEWK